MKKQEAHLLIAVLVAFIVLIVHQFICIGSGTILHPANIAFSVFLLVVILAGCLYGLGQRNYINWKQIVFLSLAVALLVLFKLFLCIPAVINYLDFAKYMSLTLFHILLQLLVGIGFIATLKRKEPKDNQKQ